MNSTLRKSKAFFHENSVKCESHCFLSNTGSQEMIIIHPMLTGESYASPTDFLVEDLATGPVISPRLSPLSDLSFSMLAERNFTAERDFPEHFRPCMPPAKVRHKSDIYEHRRRYRHHGHRHSGLEIVDGSRKLFMQHAEADSHVDQIVCQFVRDANHTDLAVLILYYLAFCDIIYII